MEGRRLPIGSLVPAQRPLLVVSIHDVAPSTARDVHWLRSRLDDLGVRRRVLKVIPNERGERPVGTDPELVEALRAEESAGSEIVLHGWTHHVDARELLVDGRSAIARIRAGLFAADTAEFLGLDATEGGRRIAAGLAALEALGLRIDGFCAPGWLAGSATRRALGDAGLRYVVSFGWLTDLATGRRWLLPGLGSMGTQDVQEWLVGAEGGFVLLARSRLPVVRAFLHPQGAARSAATARALRGIGRLCRERQVVTFRDLVERATAEAAKDAAA